MAILAISNFLLYHAETLADIQAVGSNNGVTADVVAWVEATKTWYYPNVISASTTTWVVATGFQISGDLGAAPVELSNSGLHTLTPGTSNQLVETLATLDTNGHYMKILVKVAAVDNSVDSNFVAFTYEQYFYRSGGTVSSVGAFDNQLNVVGVGEFSSNVSFNVAAVGDDLQLRASNTSSTATYTLDAAYFWTRQRGGDFAA